jgi:hypothetical protein
VLVDSVDDSVAFLDVDPAREGISLVPPPIIVMIDVREGGGFSAEAARELTVIEAPFELVDRRGP